MKRILTLALCLCMIFSLCLARAELDVPQLKPTQEELQTGFSNNLIKLLPELNVKEKALHIEMSQADQALLDALLQDLGDVFDIQGTVADMPVQAQFTEDAVMLALGEQVYKLPYQNIDLSSMLTSSADSAIIDPTIFYDLFTSFVESAIVPSFSVEADGDTQRMIFDLTQERMSASLIEMGDAVAENEQLVRMLSEFGLSDFPGMWPELRGMLEDGQLQISLHAEAVIDGDTTRLDAEGVLLGMPVNLNASLEGAIASFTLVAGDAFTVTGSLNIANGGYECHFSEQGGTTYDLALEPTSDGWKYGVKLASDGITLMSCDAVMAGDVLDGSLTIAAGDPDELITGSLHLDLQTAALTANLLMPESLGGLSIDLNGGMTGTGYRIDIDISQGGAKMATAAIVYTQTEEVIGLEFSVKTAGEAPVSLVEASFAYALQTGAFDLRYEDMSGNTITGEGVMTDEQQSCTLDFGSRDHLYRRIILDRKSDDSVFCQNFSIFEDRFYRGSLEPVTIFSIDVDKETGAFRGSYANSGDYKDCSFQGIVADGLFRLHFDSSEFGRNGALMDIDIHWGDGQFTANYSRSDGYDATTCSLIWSDALKSLSLNGDDLRLYAALDQDRHGMPKALRIVYSKDRYSSTEISIDPEKILVKSGDTTSMIKGYFKDSTTYCVDINTTVNYRYDENSIHAEFTLKDHAIEITAVNGAGDKLFEASLTPVDQTDVQRLDEQEGVVEITPELIGTILEGMSTTDADYSEDGAAAD